MKLNGYTVTPKQLRGRWKTLVSSYKVVKDNNQHFGQGTRKILGKLEGRSNWKADQLQIWKTYFTTCTTNCQEGFCAP